MDLSLISSLSIVGQVALGNSLHLSEHVLSSIKKGRYSLLAGLL